MSELWSGPNLCLDDMSDNSAHSDLYLTLGLVFIPEYLICANSSIVYLWHYLMHWLKVEVYSLTLIHLSWETLSTHQGQLQFASFHLISNSTDSWDVFVFFLGRNVFINSVRRQRVNTVESISRSKSVSSFIFELQLTEQVYSFAPSMVTKYKRPHKVVQ